MDRLTSCDLTSLMTTSEAFALSPTLQTVAVSAAIGSAAMGGVFFAFSGFVMPALARLSSSDGIRAMQSINITAVRPPLMLGLFGTAALCVPLAVRGIQQWGTPRATLLVIGSGLYLVGAIGVTIGFNVPLNDALAVVDPTSAGAADTWTDYVSRWTMGNSVRAAAAIAGAAALFAAVRQR